MSLIIPANTLASGGYEVDNSLRFNDGSSDYLSRTPSSETNTKIFTFSCWTKKSTNEEYLTLLSGNSSTSNNTGFFFNNTDELQFWNEISSTVNINIRTTAKFRDSSAWYHVVLALDTTQSTQSDRLKIYVNSVQQNLTISTNVSSDQVTWINDDVVQQVGGLWGQTGGSYYDGYMSEVVLIDGTQLDPTSFGEFDEDSGIWKPIDVSGLTFGTNGFYLEFKGAGTSANSSGIGADTSGNDNHFAVNNLTAIDQSTDTCTNNFATMNPLDNIGATTFSEGNNLLLWTATNKTNKSTIGVTSGKWYAECKAIDVNGGTSGTLIGVGTEANLASTYLSATTSGWGYRCQTGYIQNGAGNEAYGDTWAEDDIIGVALDMDNGAVYMSKNGTFQDSGDPTSGASKTNAANNQPSYGSAISGTLFFACSSYDTDSLVWNFGNPPFTISSGNTDGDGYGNFEYAVPSGYYSLCTKNLAEYG